ncbi:membrane-bound PQQ-dependent dehydrogenase, glucose/quinate/shikimate family, partial [Acinetobacter baumannii]
QLFRRRAAAVPLYGLVLIGTLAWAWVDAGFDFWPLVSRLMLPAGLTALLLATWPALRKRESKAPAAGVSYALAAAIAVAMGVTFA